MLLLAAALCGCERGCARTWAERRGVGEKAAFRNGLGPPRATDCPDGLARCTGGVVETSRLAAIPEPCQGPPESCACPWERAGECGGACVAEGAEIVVDRARALAQLCAPGPGGGDLARPISQPADCDEDTRYRCSGGAVVSCAEHRAVALMMLIVRIVRNG